jgi:hypothetical protein
VELTTKQAELWELADEKISALGMGGIGHITRNRDKAIRDAAKTEGTYEWALVNATSLQSPLMDDIMTDEHCQRLIDIITTEA